MSRIKIVVSAAVAVAMSAGLMGIQASAQTRTSSITTADRALVGRFFAAKAKLGGSAQYAAVAASESAAPGDDYVRSFRKAYEADPTSASGP